MSAFRRIAKKAATFALTTLTYGAIGGVIGTGIGTAAHVAHEGYLSYKYGSAYTLRLDVAVPPTESSALEVPLSSLKAQVEWFDYAVALRATLMETAQAMFSGETVEASPSDLFKTLALNRVEERQRTLELTELGRNMRDQNAKQSYFSVPVSVESDLSLDVLKNVNHSEYGKDMCRVMLNHHQLADIHVELLLLKQDGERLIRQSEVKRLVVQHELAHCFGQLAKPKEATQFLVEEFSKSQTLTLEQQKELSTFITQEFQKNPRYVDQLSESFADTFSFVTAAKEKWFALPQSTPKAHAADWKSAVSQWERWRFQAGNGAKHFTAPALSTLAEFNPSWIAALQPKDTVQFSRSLVAHSLLIHITTQADEAPEFLRAWESRLVGKSSQGLTETQQEKYEEMSNYLNTKNLQYLVLSPFLKTDVLKSIKHPSDTPKFTSSTPKKTKPS